MPITWQYNGWRIIFIAGSHFTVAAKGKLGLPKLKGDYSLFKFYLHYWTILVNKMPLIGALREMKFLQILLKNVLITSVVENEELEKTTEELINKLINNSPNAIRMGLQALKKLPKMKET